MIGDWTLAELQEALETNNQREMAEWSGSAIHMPMPKYQSWVSFYPYGYNEEYVPVLTLDKAVEGSCEYENVAFVILDTDFIKDMDELEYTRYLARKQSTLIYDYEEASSGKPLKKEEK